ncbi:dimethylamine monooxygenase subunit DmmA family protein [Alteribacillus sp. YIM 98480]|uniref:dimethylamine monooxygenase subunit DmmA family protein n=1 Tax=Alteribacillus sp. YIM 98480 TaxID=2606599 RepID=UPI00131D5EC9|nr:dimethylamine monooxygenase subunit DmmA family protein [Alteribacillus sp. YIM 98480]
MEEKKCELLRKEKIGHHIHKLEVKMDDAVLSKDCGKIRTIKWEGHVFEHPILYVRISKRRKKYYLFLDESKSECSLLRDRFPCSNFYLQEDEEYVPAYVPRNNDQKVISFIDEQSLFDTLPVIDLLLSKNIEQQIYAAGSLSDNKIKQYLNRQLQENVTYMTSFTSTHISSILSGQFIGTSLSITGTWPVVQELKKLAVSQGFTEEEIQCKGVGPKQKKVFCVKCYSINELKEDMNCPDCHADLDVSDHFSRRLEAYLGYIEIE